MTLPVASATLASWVGNALGVSATWNNRTGTLTLNTGTNWVGGVAPSANLDLANFDNTTNLGSLTWNAAFGPTSGNAGGIIVNYTGTNNLTLGEATTVAFGLSNVIIAAGARVFTLGNGSGTANLTVRSSAMTLSNASANLATIQAEVVFANGGGTGNRNVTFNGSGNWNVAGVIFPSGFSAVGSASLTKDGAGTMTLGSTNFHGGGTTIALGTLLVTNGSALGTGTVTIAGGGYTKVLQAQTNALSGGLTTATNAWFDVAGTAASTTHVVTINPANPTVFYHLRPP